MADVVFIYLDKVMYLLNKIKVNTIKKVRQDNIFKLYTEVLPIRSENQNRVSDHKRDNPIRNRVSLSIDMMNMNRSTIL